MTKKLILILDTCEDVFLNIVKETTEHLIVSFYKKNAFRIPKSAIFCYENDINYYASPYSLEPYCLQKLKFS